MFERTDDFMGGSLQGYCSISPARLVEVFGRPGDGDDYKVSGEFTFVDSETGEFFTLYDWKHTTLYDYAGEPGVPTPEEFWGSTYQYEFHIGGDGNTDLAKIVAAVESLESRRVSAENLFTLPSGN